MLVPVIGSMQEQSVFTNWKVRMRGYATEPEAIAVFPFLEGKGTLTTSWASGDPKNTAQTAGDSADIYGATWLQGAGRWSKKPALSFDGVDDYIHAQNLYGVTGKDPRTIMAWVKTVMPLILT